VRAAWLVAGQSLLACPALTKDDDRRATLDGAADGLFGAIIYGRTLFGA